MSQMGKLLVLAGIVLILIGAAVWALGRLGFRGIPGDINYESGNVRVYFPVIMCLVLSVLLTLGLWLWRWLSGKP